jgi:hypothetical protein
MQNLQSQLGKSLSLQLLMTVPRRNLTRDGAAWLQVKALDFLQLLSRSLVRLQFVQISARIQKPWPVFRDAAIAPARV